MLSSTTSRPPSPPASRCRRSIESSPPRPRRASRVSAGDDRFLPLARVGDGVERERVQGLDAERARRRRRRRPPCRSGRSRPAPSASSPSSGSSTRYRSDVPMPEPRAHRHQPRAVDDARHAESNRQRDARPPAAPVNHSRMRSSSKHIWVEIQPPTPGLGEQRLLGVQLLGDHRRRRSGRARRDSRRSRRAPRRDRRRADRG